MFKFVIQTILWVKVIRRSRAEYDIYQGHVCTLCLIYTYILNAKKTQISDNLQDTLSTANLDFGHSGVTVYCISIYLCNSISHPKVRHRGQTLIKVQTQNKCPNVFQD